MYFGITCALVERVLICWMFAPILSCRIIAESAVVSDSQSKLHAQT